jgi:hypothetical protein
MKTFLKRLRASAHMAGYGWVIPITESDPSGKHVTFTWNAGSERDGDERSVTALMVGSSLESVLVVDGDITLERSATFDSLSGCLYTLILPQRVPILDARTYDHTQDCPS